MFKYARPAVSALKRLRLSDDEGQQTALVIGSNVGSEAFYFSLWLRVRTIGVEILCDLNDLADKMRNEFDIPKHALEFICEDALSETLIPQFQRAGIVWLDDQTFDRDLVLALGSRLSQYVSSESTIITYRPDILLSTNCFERVGIPSNVVTTWSTSVDGFVSISFLRSVGVCTNGGNK